MKTMEGEKTSIYLFIDTEMYESSQEYDIYFIIC